MIFKVVPASDRSFETTAKDPAKIVRFARLEVEPHVRSDDPNAVRKGFLELLQLRNFGRRPDSVDANLHQIADGVLRPPRPSCFCDGDAIDSVILLEFVRVLK
jgi:hypothetical protein